jgi:hypothetical protein
VGVAGAPRRADRGAGARARAGDAAAPHRERVSPFLACIGWPCLRQCVHRDSMMLLRGLWEKSSYETFDQRKHELRVKRKAPKLQQVPACSVVSVFLVLSWGRLPAITPAQAIAPLVGRPGIPCPASNAVTPAPNGCLIEAPWLVNGGHGASLRRRGWCRREMVATRLTVWAGAGGTAQTLASFAAALQPEPQFEEGRMLTGYSTQGPPDAAACVMRYRALS